MLDQLPVGVSIAEVPAGRIVFHNRAAVRLLGHEMRSGPDYTAYARYGALHADGRPYRAEEYPTARALLHGDVIVQEWRRYRRGDGTETILAVSAELLGRLPEALSTMDAALAAMHPEDRPQVEATIRSALAGTAPKGRPPRVRLSCARRTASRSSSV